MNKRTNREVFPQVASMQQFFNYGHATPQVPFTMQVGGTLSQGMSNMASQTGQLPMMNMGSNIIDRQLSDAKRMGYMADGGISNTNTAPNFYINKLDKFIGKVKGMAARANEKSLMEDALGMAQEKGIFQNGGPRTVSNNTMFTGMDFSKASNFLNNYNNLYKAANAEKLYGLANSMRSTAIANSTPYAKLIHTYDLENPYMQEDATPINLPDPNRAMFPKDLGMAKYGLETYQSDIKTGEKKDEVKPKTNEELMAEIDAQNKRIEALEAKKSKCASGNCSPEEEADIAKEEENVKTSSSDLQGRLAVMDVKDKYRWNAASRFGNLLRGSSDPGRPGQLRERTYHYEFGKKGEMPPMGMAIGTGSMPSGVASIATDNSDVWKKWQGAAGVGEKPKTETKTTTDKPSKDPYNIYPDSWENQVLNNQPSSNAFSPVKTGFTPRVNKPMMEDEWIDNPTPLPIKIETKNPTSRFVVPSDVYNGTPVNFNTAIRTPEELRREVEALKQQRMMEEMESDWISNPTPIPVRVTTNNPVNRMVVPSDVYNGTPVNFAPDDMPYGPVKIQGMSPLVETYRKGGLAKFIKKYAGDVEPSEVFDPGAWEINTGEDFGNSQGLGYQQAATASEPMPIGKAPKKPENSYIDTGQDILEGQNFGLGMYIAPTMEFIAQRRDAAKQKKGDVMNQFGYNNLVNPVLGDNGPEDQFGNQFVANRNFNMYEGKEGGSMYEEGGVYFLDDETIKQLKKGGAIIEYLD